MIFVAGDMTINPAVVDDFVRDVAAMRPKVLTEPGCIHYSLLVQDKAAGLINVHEVWTDDDALKVHFTMPWIGEFFTKYVGHIQKTSVEVYDIAGAPRPLPSM